MSQATADHSTGTTIADTAERALAAQAVMEDTSLSAKAPEYVAALHDWASARDALTAMVARTLAECQAKARVLLTGYPDEDAASLCRDILAIDASA